MDEKRANITPAELKNLQFDRKMRGYDPEQVDEITQLAADSLEQSLLAINALKADVKRLEEKVADFERMEATIKDTLVSTQGSVDEIKRNALKEAELIRREAEVTAAEEIELHQRKAEQIKAEIEKLKTLHSDYLIRIKSLVSGHQEMLEKLTNSFDSPYLAEGATPDEYTD